MFTRRGVYPCSMALALGLVIGCGGDRLGRVAVSGEVTLAGEPLAEGSITFLPEGDGISVGGKIADGRYQIPKADGPAPGTYHVRVHASVPTGKTFVDPAGGIEVPEVKELVPARYNLQTELTATVTADEPNTFDFALEPE